MKNEMPWYYSIFNPDMLKEMAEKMSKEAEKQGMTLEEYLKSRSVDNQRFNGQ